MYETQGEPVSRSFESRISTKGIHFRHIRRDSNEHTYNNIVALILLIALRIAKLTCTLLVNTERTTRNRQRRRRRIPRQTVAYLGL